MDNPKLLIIDDDEGIRTQLKWGLGDYEIITASSRTHALEQFNLHNPPLVTLDLGMPPDVDGTTEGFETLKAILKKAPETRVVIVSAAEEPANAEIAKREGAFSFYSKPVDLEQLHQLIAQAYEDYKSSAHCPDNL